MDIGDLFQLAVKRSASDILISANTPPALRINGELAFVNCGAVTADETKALVYSILGSDQIAKFEAEKELDFSLYVQDLHRFRANVYLQRGCVGAAFRLIPGVIPSSEELGLPRMVEDLALRPQGMVLVTGPTGHGKSTTQAAMVDLINKQRRVHVITVEDPIEYVHTNQKSVVDQREVGGDTHSFSAALKHVLRQDPDVILIGEMRDLDTISAALTAAETGHLVLATLHTNDAIQSVDRLLDVFPPHQQGQIRTQLGFCLLAVIAQRLIPRIDRPGLVVATEILMNTSASANLIREGKTHQLYTVMETSARDGMHTMDSSLKQLYLKGIIAYEEAQKRMRNPKVLESR